MAFHRVYEGLGISSSSQDWPGMLQVLIGMPLVVYIVQETDDSPVIGVLSMFDGKMPHRRFNRQRMPQ
jgi:hypothetical protein